MRRRDFMMFLCGALALVEPRAPHAQQIRALRVGVLVLGNPDPEPFLTALREALKRVGYIDGQNIQLEFRSARGNASLLPEAAAELVGLKADIIVTLWTQATEAVKQATNEIPIVMVAVGDPVGVGIIASLGRPGGNITGTGGLGADLGGKLVDIVREALPSVRRVAILLNVAGSFAKPFLAQIENNAPRFGIEVRAILRRPGEDFDSAFEEMRRTQVEAVIIQPELLSKGFPDLALKRRLPAFSINRQFAVAGGLMSYDRNYTEIFRATAVYVDRILRGAKPAELPVEQPTKFELVINLRTAKALGITIPSSLIDRADEVIE